MGIVNGTPKLEVGKWYKLLENGSIAFLGSHDTFEYGISMIEGGEWIGYPTSLNEPDQWVEATPQEVEEALVKEAKRRGFKKGVTFNLIDRSKFCRNVILGEYKVGDYITYLVHENGEEVILTGGQALYSSGKWAEVIAEPQQQTSLEQDIQQLKDKYKQYKFTITIEDNI